MPYQGEWIAESGGPKVRSLESGLWTSSRATAICQGEENAACALQRVAITSPNHFACAPSNFGGVTLAMTTGSALAYGEECAVCRPSQCS